MIRILLKAVLLAALLAGCGQIAPATGTSGFWTFGSTAKDEPAAPRTPVPFPAKVASSLASMPTTNNRIEVFPDRQAYPELERMIAGAKRSIWLETFTWTMDESGLRLADLLARKRAQGVEVRVLVDPFGQGQYKAATGVVQWLKAHDVDTRLYRDMHVFPRGFLHFTHRKLYLVDGYQAMTGGMNIGYEYDLIWHDLLVRADGDVAGQMHREFLRDWKWSGGSDLPVPPVPDRVFGTSTAVAIGTAPHEPGRGGEIHRVLLEAIDGAKQRIWVGYPYWGDQALVDHLGAAAKRGVDVRVIVPFENDTPVFKIANRFIIRDLLALGVKVRWWTKGFSHSKYMVVDDITEIGSSNGDTSSFEYQQEMDLLSADPEIAKRFVETVPAADWERDCRDVVPADLVTPWTERPKEAVLERIQRYL